ncbi:MAG: alpha/beta fold hydrolase, partial [Elusimicrobia bacterium]|nr:alpha/beta fold hydrolase [Elusimicrobiota bacterium]
GNARRAARLRDNRGKASGVPGPTLPGFPVSFPTSDGWTISAQYRPAKKGLLTLVLIPGVGERRDVWSDLAHALVRAGYGTLILDLRGQGASTLGPDGKPVSWRQFSDVRDGNDFLGMSNDVAAAAVYLSSSAGVSISSVGFVGNGLGASLAVRYAAVHPEVPLTALLSPTLNGENVPIISALRAYGSRPILIAYSLSDRRVANAAPLIFAVAKLSAGAANATLVATHLPANYLFDRSTSDRILNWIETAPQAAQAAAVAASTAAAAGQVEISSPSADAPPASLPAPSL